MVKLFGARVDMGEPILEPEKIPVEFSKNPVKGLKIKVEDREFDPHAITFIEENVKEFDVAKYGKIIEVDRIFPKRTNVEFINIIDKNNLKMRVWERGAGETLACGTGACATAVAAVLNGYTKRNVTIELLGGKLEIEWNEKDNHVYMTGPATTVFEGEI